MTEPEPRHVLPVSSDPSKALEQTVLDELNRMNDRIRATEHKQAALEKENAVLAERVSILWGALSALGQPPQ